VLLGSLFYIKITQAQIVPGVTGLPAYDSGWRNMPEGPPGLILTHNLDTTEVLVYVTGYTEHGLHDPDTNVTNDNPIITGKIALAHLNEFPDYYTRLEEMEEKAEEFHKK